MSKASMSLTLRSGQNHIPLAQHARRPGTVEGYFGRAYSNAPLEINASSNIEAARHLRTLAGQVERGELQIPTVSQQTVEQSRQQNVVTASVTMVDRNQQIVAAYRDKVGGKFMEIGAAIAAEVSETSNREGFMRQVATRGEVQQGSPARIRVRTKNVTALLAAGPAQNEAIFVRDRYIYPKEVYVTANVRVEKRDIDQGSGDMMEDAYLNTLEQITLTEDRLWKQLVDNSVGIANNLQVLAGGATPSSIVAMRTEVSRWNLPAQTIVMAEDLWNDILGNAASWGNLFDPVTQFEAIQTGYIGTLLGMKIISDAYRVPQLRVLSSGEIYILAAPEQHAVYTDRGPVNASPVEVYPDGVPARGWVFDETVSITVFNARSVSKGIRA